MNRSYNNSAQSPKVKYLAAYSKGRELSRKRYCVTPAVSEWGSYGICMQF